jgi:uncharacterized protein YqhQ
MHWGTGCSPPASSACPSSPASASQLIKFAGRNRSRRWVRVLMWPGLELQLLTTREPDLDQLAVAVAALEVVLALETPGEASAEDLLGVEVVA